jgi:hypothetical protein
MGIWHLTFATDGRLPLFTDEGAIRRAVLALGAVAADEILLFAIVDDHLHLVVRCDVARRGRIECAVSLALRPLVSAPVGTPNVRPVLTRSHLRWLVTYLLTQARHHGLAAHPALATGACFQDLVGARVVHGISARPLREALPRLRCTELCEIVEVRPPVRLGDDAIRSLGLGRLLQVASATLAAPPELAGRTALVVEARRLAAELACMVRVSRTEVCWALGLTRQGLHKLAGRPAAPAALAALRMRLALEETLGADRAVNQTRRMERASGVS